MKTLIECFAAAFCGTETKTSIPAPRTKETEAAIAVIRAMHGNARFLKDGMLHVYPVKFRPAPEGICLPPVTGDEFLFFTGIAAAEGIAFAADDISDPPDTFACAAVQKALGVPECLSSTPVGGLRCGVVAPPDVFTLFPRLPEAFAAGALVGAALAPRDTDFIFSGAEPGKTLLLAWDALRAHGVRIEELIDGWRVFTRVDDLPPIPEKQRKKRKYWIQGLRL